MASTSLDAWSELVEESRNLILKHETLHKGLALLSNLAYFLQLQLEKLVKVMIGLKLEPEELLNLHENDLATILLQHVIREPPLEPHISIPHLIDALLRLERKKEKVSQRVYEVSDRPLTRLERPKVGDFRFSRPKPDVSKIFNLIRSKKKFF